MTISGRYPFPSWSAHREEAMKAGLIIVGQGERPGTEWIAIQVRKETLLLSRCASLILLHCNPDRLEHLYILRFYPRVQLLMYVFYFTRPFL
jgi:hypothetical protein